MPPPASNRRSTSPTTAALEGWAASHLRCLVEALGRLHRRWVASLLTTVVIGITLALPAGLYILVKNLDGLTYSWKTSVQISVYLDQSVSNHSGRQLARRIATFDDVDKVRYISPDEGLAAFKKNSGLSDALTALPNNPLPPVIAVTPEAELPHSQVTALLDELRTLGGVQQAALDQAWLRRLNAILSVLERTAWVIGLLLAAAVIFIVGNTIRLDIENRRDEIEVMKLIGASDSFIRRPFLYSGMWYGLGGALLALILIGLCFFALAGPLSTLTRSYEGSIELSGIGWSGGFWLIVAGIALGWSGCVLTVNQRLRAIEPG